MPNNCDAAKSNTAQKYGYARMFPILYLCYRLHKSYPLTVF